MQVLVRISLKAIFEVHRKWECHQNSMKVFIKSYQKPVKAALLHSAQEIFHRLSVVYTELASSMVVNIYRNKCWFLLQSHQSNDKTITVTAHKLMLFVDLHDASLLNSEMLWAIRMLTYWVCMLFLRNCSLEGVSPASNNQSRKQWWIENFDGITDPLTTFQVANFSHCHAKDKTPYITESEYIKPSTLFLPI